MPLWLSSLRFRPYRWPIQPCIRSRLRQPRWQRRPHLQRSYGTALRENREDDTSQSTVTPAHEPFDDAKYLLGLPSSRDDARQETGNRGYASTEASSEMKSTQAALVQTAKTKRRRRRIFRTNRRNARLRVMFWGRRRKVVYKHQSQFVTRRTKRMTPAPKSANYVPWKHLTNTPSNYLLIWRRQLSKIDVNYQNKSEEEWYQLRWVPITDVRAAGWSERLLERLDEGVQILSEDELSFDFKGPAYVWMEVALWLLTYDQRSMIRFLLATHLEPYQSEFRVEDSLLYLAQYWSNSQEADSVFQLQQLANAFGSLADRGENDRLTFFNPFFRILIQYCSDDQIQDLYRTIKRQKVSTHWWTYLHFTTHFAKRNRFQQAFEALMDARNAGAELNSWHFRSNCATLLRKSSEQPDGLRVCLRIVSELVDIGVELNNPICDIIMLNAVEAGDLKTAFSVYHSLVERGLQPTESTFAVLLKGCKMNIDDAETLNETIRNAIENVAVRKSEVLSTEILHCLALHHSKHNPTTALHTLTEAYAQLFDLRPLQKLGLPIPKIPQQHDDFMPPTQHALNFMIGASIDHYLERVPYATGILPLYERWREQVEAREPSLANLATSDYTANIFLKAFILRPSGLIHATRVVRDMQRPLPPSAGVEQVKPTVQSWSIFLHGFTRHGKTKLAEQVLNYMRSKGVEPNHVTWNTLVTGYARAQDEEGTLDALRRAEQGGLVWDRWTYAGLKWLRNQQRLKAELEKGRLQRRLDFTNELKKGMGERLSEA